MAFVVMSTQVSGFVVPATEWNKIVNNFKLTIPGLVTTLGDIGVATGTNATKRLAAFNGSDVGIHEVGLLEADVKAITTGGILVGQSAGVIGIEVAMTQVVSEAGTETQVKGTTAERMSQAIAALSDDKDAHAFCAIQLDGTIESDSFNCSITDTGTGVRTVVWTTDFANDNYSCIGGFRELNVAGGDSQIYFDTPAVGSIIHRIYDEGVNVQDQKTSVVSYGVSV